MNERILKLCLQAADGTVDPNSPFTPEEVINLQVKLAELIVRECLRIVESNIHGPAGPHDYSYTDENYAADERAETIYNEVGDYFGVK
jgi:hypothetical protein